MTCPGDGHVFVSAYQLTSDAIEHIEKAVLWRLQQHLAGLSAHLNVSKNHVLGGGVIPGVTRSRLVVPHVVAGVGVECDNR